MEILSYSILFRRLKTLVLSQCKSDLVKLDDYFKNTDIEFDFINSNIQGTDFAGIQGMQSLLQ